MIFHQQFIVTFNILPLQQLLNQFTKKSAQLDVLNNFQHNLTYVYTFYYQSQTYIKFWVTAFQQQKKNCSVLQQIQLMESSFQKIQLNPEYEEIRCRICYDVSLPLISLCECSGSIAFVHEDCILDWITKKMQNSQVVEIPHCEICKARYSARMNVGSKKISVPILIQKIKALNKVEITTTIFFLISFLIALYSIICTILNSFRSSFNSQQNWITILFLHIIFPSFFCYLSAQHFRKRKRLAQESVIQIVEVILQPKMTLK